MIQENRDRHGQIARRLQDTVRLQAARKRAARDAVQQHALAGRKIAVWRDGQVVWEEASNSTVETLAAILGSVLPQSRHIDSIRRILDRLSAHWFVRATARRCGKLERELASQGRPEAFPLIVALKKFGKSLSAVSQP